MNTTPAAPKRSLKSRIKHHTPEIIVGVSLVAGVVSALYIRKSLAAPLTTVVVDAGVEVVSGGEDVFAILTTEAYQMLKETGRLVIDETANSVTELYYTVDI